MAGRVPGANPRVAFVNTHPIQYFAPLYRYINAHSSIEAVPIYLSDHSLRGAVDKGFGHAVTWDVDLLSGMSPIFAKGAETRTVETGVFKMMVPQVWSLIRNGNFDAVVVHGHATGANHVAWAAAKSIGIPIFTRGEMHLDLVRSTSRSLVRDLIMPWFYRAYDGVLAIGSANQDYYRAMGVPERKISLFPYSVDNDRLIAASTLDPDQRAEVRQRFEIDLDRPAILYASKFQARKYPDDLIRACAALQAEGLAFNLVLAGAGEMDAELRALAASFPDLKTVFTGFVNQSELPRLFGACDAFVLQSRDEPWGLIVNEAMCAGLPVVVSKEVGCVKDIVREGVNGFAIPAQDVGALTSALRTLLLDPAKLKAMGSASRDIIRGWSYRECLIGLADALEKSGAAKGIQITNNDSGPQKR